LALQDEMEADAAPLLRHADGDAVAQLGAKIELAAQAQRGKDLRNQIRLGQWAAPPGRSDKNRRRKDSDCRSGACQSPAAATGGETDNDLGHGAGTDGLCLRDVDLR